MSNCLGALIVRHDLQRTTGVNKSSGKLACYFRSAGVTTSDDTDESLIDAEEHLSELETSVEAAGVGDCCRICGLEETSLTLVCSK